MKYLLIFLIGAIGFKNGITLKVTGLEFKDRVPEGADVELNCIYNLETDTLYKVTWYKGQQEFLRYTEHETPNISQFPLFKKTKVVSNSPQKVTLKNVTTEVTGNYTCQVDTEGPTLRSERVTKTLLVVTAPGGNEVKNKDSVNNPSGRNVDTQIKLVVPPIVNKSDTIKISCSYDPAHPNKKSHQSVVLYRNNEEFYKFEANKGFDLTLHSMPGVTASVHQTDNITEVTLRNATAKTEGEYSCGLSSNTISKPKYLLVREQSSLPVQISMPKIIRKDQTVQLKCSFNFNQNDLKSVTWFKGNRKIYEYHPNEKSQITQIDGIGHIVDITSEEYKGFLSAIQIKNVTSNTSGRYICEVKTENRQTYRDSSSMSLLHLPNGEPTMFIESDYLRNGDFIKAECASGPSYPLATITWYIDGVKAHSSQMSTSRGNINFPYPATSTIHERVHFKEGVNSVRVSCEVAIGHWYKKEKTATIERNHQEVDPSDTYTNPYEYPINNAYYAGAENNGAKVSFFAITVGLLSLIAMV
ncbi:unnamed protein product [Phyllotreta striolata]|uniref:Ig-like domain-containing protein n=1 Tax=Phyllotreta striolata TaxID=444603 RepID=A0A9N9TQ37_PHYSR|nr:unnamed protein product [Phyllotreta striolata]